VRPRRTVVAGVVAGAALLVASCGVPTGGRPETIPRTAVPYGLASSTPSAPAATSSPVLPDRPRIYLVDPDDALVPRARDAEGGTVRERLADLLAGLASGPTRGERGDRLSTALPPGVRLTVPHVDAGTATVDIRGAEDAPSGRASRRAVAQIVLTATSLPDVSTVLLTQNGQAVEAPLPSGELTSAPLTAADYAPMLTRSPAPAASSPSS
jgi:hypothetical protein